MFMKILFFNIFLFIAPSSSLYSLSLPSTPTAMSPISAAVAAAEEKPPPLPQKQAYADYTNITDDFQFSSSPLRKNSLSLSLRTKNKVRYFLLMHMKICKSNDIIHLINLFIKQFV